MPAKFSSLENAGIDLPNIRPILRLIDRCLPPRNQCAHNFIDDFTSLLEDCDASPHTTIIAVDFNIHMHEKINTLSKSLTSSLEMFGLKQNV